MSQFTLIRCPLALTISGAVLRAYPSLDARLRAYDYRRHSMSVLKTLIADALAARVPLFAEHALYVLKLMWFAYRKLDSAAQRCIVAVRDNATTDNARLMARLLECQYMGRSDAGRRMLDTLLVETRKTHGNDSVEVALLGYRRLGLMTDHMCEHALLGEVSRYVEATRAAALRNVVNREAIGHYVAAASKVLLEVLRACKRETSHAAVTIFDHALTYTYASDIALVEALVTAINALLDDGNVALAHALSIRNVEVSDAAWQQVRASHDAALKRVAQALRETPCDSAPRSGEQGQQC